MDDPAVLTRVQTLLHPRKRGYHFSWALNMMSEKWSETVCHRIEFLRTSTALHTAAALKLPDLCAWLIAHGCDANQVSSRGSPLWAAICPYAVLEEGDLGLDSFEDRLLLPEEALQVVDVLLEAGADLTNDIETRQAHLAIHSLLCPAFQMVPTEEMIAIALIRNGALMDEECMHVLEHPDDCPPRLAVISASQPSNFPIALRSRLFRLKLECQAEASFDHTAFPLQNPIASDIVQQAPQVNEALLRIAVEFGQTQTVQHILQLHKPAGVATESCVDSDSGLEAEEESSSDLAVDPEPYEESGTVTPMPQRFILQPGKITGILFACFWIMGLAFARSIAEAELLYLLLY